MVFKMEFGIDFPLEMVNVLFYSVIELDVLMEVVMLLVFWLEYIVGATYGVAWFLRWFQVGFFRLLLHAADVSFPSVIVSVSIDHGGDFSSEEASLVVVGVCRLDFPGALGS